MPSLTLTQIQNSTVLLRADLNLPSLQDDARVVATIPTIRQLVANHNKVVILTHWGRPEGPDPKLSTKLLAPVIEKHLGQPVEFINQFARFAQAKLQIDTSDKQVFLLENTRFEPKEQAKDSQVRLTLAQEYATLGTVFVDEAFAVSHRQEATNYELKQLLPHCLGLNYEQEIQHLDKIKLHPTHPYAVIISGSKLETKLSLIEKFLDKADYILLAGMICFTFIQAQTELVQTNQVAANQKLPNLADSPIETDFLPRAKEILKQYGSKLILPVDFAYYQDGQKTLAYDIGPETVSLFQTYLSQCQTIFWNGPLGVYEQPPFDQGTKAIAQFLVSLIDTTKPYIVTGGGDINSAIPEDCLAKFTWVSTGGGATLEYLSS